MFQEKISNIIKQIRKDNNLTQQELANKLGVTYQAVSKWENGKNIPDKEILTKISTYYNIDLNELITGKKKQTVNKKILILIIISIIIIISLIILLLTKDTSINLKTVSSACTDFNLIGTAAYNNDKTSISIQEINYCGTKTDIVYSKITCTLYEEYEDTKKTISTCEEKENIKLNDYLDNLKINVKDYKKLCKKIDNTNIVLEINAYDESNNITSYEIPLTLDNDCN